MDGVRHSRRLAGFTLVELLVSMTVIAIMLLVLSQMTSALRATISRTTSQLEQFRNARNAFETMTRRIGQATLNGYDDLDPTASAITSGGYVRASELRFRTDSAATLFMGVSGASGSLHHPTHAIFFQAPLGVTTADNAATYASLNRLLNTCGYYIEWNSDASQRPPFLSSVTPTLPVRWRFRLMELIEPADTLSVYKYTSGTDGTTPPKTKSWTYTGLDWFQTPLNLTSPPVHAVAENVILLALLPMVSPKDAKMPAGGDQDGTSIDLTTNYSYDSASALRPDIRNKLPPMVYVVMIAVDEKSFGRYMASQADSTAFPTALDLEKKDFLTDATYGARKIDIDTVTNDLIRLHIDYRVFTASIPLTPN